MSKHLLLFLIAIGSIISADEAAAQQAGDKVMATVRQFPYQHLSDVDAVLTGMDGWNKSEWKSLFRLLNDDSLKSSAADALSAYVNAATLDAAKKDHTVGLIKKYAGAARTDYAKQFIQAQLNMLTDRAAIDRQNATLPALPAYNPAPASSLTGERQLLLLEDEMGLAQNPIEKKRILARAGAIPGFSSFMLVSKSLKDPAVNKDAAMILTRLALADATIRGPVVREALET
ncbi:MAG TPA: hypothetical protein VIM64_03765, partial [Puia sp.]